MTYTIENAKAYAADNLADIMHALRECAEVPEWFKKNERFVEVWKSGCWLNMMLKRDHGASAQEVRDIGFAHGQRSAFGDTWHWAVVYANEYAANKSVKDKPGNKLADEINAGVFPELAAKLN